MTLAPAQHYIAADPARTLSYVRCANNQACAWLIEDLQDIDGLAFGAKRWSDESARPLVIVANAPLAARQRMERYGTIISWHARLDVTGEYTSYGLDAQAT
jgi:hypothetical protein